MERGPDDAQFDVALHPKLREEASELNNTLLEEGGHEKAEVAAAAT
jgi:hypothetical protein